MDKTEGDEINSKGMWNYPGKFIAQDFSNLEKKIQAQDSQNRGNQRISPQCVTVSVSEV